MLGIEHAEILLFAALLVAIVARRLRLPYTVGLVIAGAALAALGWIGNITLTPDLIYRALLPPLIFEAAFFISWDELRANLKPVLLLAIAGTVLSAAVIGAGTHWANGWSWIAALTFGALIAATDPVSVIAMFKELKVGGRLRLLLEAESLLNDGVAAVLFSITVLVATGGAATPGGVGLGLLQQMGGGILCGAAVAAAALFLVGRTDDNLVEIAFTTVAAFGSFLLADHFGCSGVMATLVAGLMIGNLAHIGGIVDERHHAVASFWEFAAFVANSIIFLLIGARELSMGSSLAQHLGAVAAAIAFSIVARAITVYGLCATLPMQDRVETPQQHVLFWGGLKGALSLALVLGLPDGFPYREDLAAATFGVVTFSIIVQGCTMPTLLRRLNITEPASRH